MWFDVQAALAETKAGEKPALTAATPATSATQAPETRPRVAIVASVATPLPRKLENTPGASNPETYLDFLHASGSTTYGAAATALGWGATRAWQAEARLRAAGLVRLPQTVPPLNLGSRKWPKRWWLAAT
jgi:hypothetical protein